MPRTHPDHPQLRIFDHPLIQEKLTTARDARTPHADFRRLLNEIAGLMTFEASRHFLTQAVEIETPLGPTSGVMLSQPITLVPILRAGVGMTEGILALIPQARVGHLGVYRDETSLEPVSYYTKLPSDIDRSHVLLVDPMLATGGSASFAASELKRVGCREIRMICLVCAPEGVRRMESDHPDVLVLAAGIDERLDERGYILPGLGDAGDRIFGTQ